MNEIMICLGDAGWVYYKTDETNCKWAIEEFEKALENAGVNTDNLNIKEAYLRNEEGNDIDRYVGKEVLEFV